MRREIKGLDYFRIDVDDACARALGARGFNMFEREESVHLLVCKATSVLSLYGQCGQMSKTLYVRHIKSAQISMLIIAMPS